MRNKTFFFLFLCYCSIPVLGGKTTTVSPLVLDRNGTGAVVLVTVPVLILLVLMTIFGHRMRWSGIRFFTVNLCLWGLVHMAYISGYYDEVRSPFPQWFQSDFWTEQKTHIETITRSVFPIGFCILVFERMILVCVPHLEEDYIFNFFFGLWHLTIPNGLIWYFATIQMDEKTVVCDSYPWTDPNCWIYDPVELLGFAVFGIYTTVVSLYHVFCLFGFCCCCYSMANYATSEKTARTFVDMWVLAFYGQFPAIMYYPSFGMSVFTFMMSKMLTWLNENGLLKIFLGGGGDQATGWMAYLDLATLTNMGLMFLEAMPWFLALFPLVQAVLTIFCFSMYREQFFYLVSFGKMYHGPPEKMIRRRNTLATFKGDHQATVPIYPTNGQAITSPRMNEQPIASPIFITTIVEKPPAPATPPNPPPPED